MEGAVLSLSRSIFYASGHNHNLINIPRLLSLIGSLSILVHYIDCSCGSFVNNAFPTTGGVEGSIMREVWLLQYAKHISPKLVTELEMVMEVKPLQSECLQLFVFQPIMVEDRKVVV